MTTGISYRALAAITVCAAASIILFKTISRMQIKGSSQPPPKDRTTISRTESYTQTDDSDLADNTQCRCSKHKCATKRRVDRSATYQAARNGINAAKLEKLEQSISTMLASLEARLYDRLEISGWKPCLHESCLESGKPKAFFAAKSDLRDHYCMAHNVTEHADRDMWDYPGQARAVQGPVILERKSDGASVMLTCPVCARTNFGSAEGFIDHCQKGHDRNFVSQDEAIEQCGELLKFEGGERGRAVEPLFPRAYDDEDYSGLEALRRAFEKRNPGTSQPGNMWGGYSMQHSPTSDD